MKKILVIGIRGMAGHVIYNYFKNKSEFDVYGIARNIDATKKEFSLDVSDITKLSEIITSGSYDFVVNCIGILNKDAEDHPAKAIWFNSYFPHFLEQATKNTSTKIIHISTDCVFSGKKGNYTEDDIKDGIGFYAQSKALGEIVNDKDITIRTSIIGPELNKNGIGLFHWFMSQKDGSNLKGYSKAFWSGVTTLELAEVILHTIDQNITGLIQVSFKEKIDKYNLLLLFKDIYNKNSLAIESFDNYVVDKSLKSIRQDFQYNVKSYPEMLVLQKKWIEDYKELYQHYL